MKYFFDSLFMQSSCITEKLENNPYPPKSTKENYDGLKSTNECYLGGLLLLPSVTNLSICLAIVV